MLVEAVDEVEAAFPGLQAAFVDALDQIGLLVDKDFFGLSLGRFVDRCLLLVGVGITFVLVQDLESSVEQVAAEEGDLAVALRMDRDADGSVGKQRRQGRDLSRQRGWVRFTHDSEHDSLAPLTNSPTGTSAYGTALDDASLCRSLVRSSCLRLSVGMSSSWSSSSAPMSCVSKAVSSPSVEWGCAHVRIRMRSSCFAYSAVARVKGKGDPNRQPQ